jgi:hypothetical protein
LTDEKYGVHVRVGVNPPSITLEAQIKETSEESGETPSKLETSKEVVIDITTV